MHVVVSEPWLNKEKYSNKLTETFSGYNVIFHFIADSEDYSCLDKASAWLAGPGQVNEERLAIAKNLELIQTSFMGLEGLPLETIAYREITLAIRKGAHTNIMAEYAVWMMLQFNVQATRLYKNQQKKKWERFWIEELSGKRLCILGMGGIGRKLAEKCVALGMEVNGIDKYPNPVNGVKRIVEPKEEYEELIKEADFVVSLLPQTNETINFVDAAFLANMRSSAFFINLSRGPIVDENALINVLESGDIAGAALDVFNKEPLDSANPLWNTKNLLITSHNSGLSIKLIDKMIPDIIHNLTVLINGKGEYVNVVDNPMKGF